MRNIVTLIDGNKSSKDEYLYWKAKFYRKRKKDVHFFSFLLAFHFLCYVIPYILHAYSEIILVDVMVSSRIFMFWEGSSGKYFEMEK